MLPVSLSLIGKLCTDSLYWRMFVFVLHLSAIFLPSRRRVQTFNFKTLYFFSDFRTGISSQGHVLEMKLSILSRMHMFIDTDIEKFK